MYRIYLALCIVFSTIVLIVGFQNLIANTPAYILTGIMSSGILIFVCAILGAGAGVCFLLYYLSKKAAMDQESESQM